MEIKEILLYNFRNFAYEKAKITPGLNLILGENGAGKTNFLEALSFIYTGKGFGDPGEKVLKIGEEKGGVMGEFKEGVRSLRKVVYVEGSGFKREINNKFVYRMNHFKTHNIVYFSPYDTLLIDGSPDNRRKFFDEIISTVSDKYERNLRDYYKLIRYRNQYLKNYSNPFRYLDIEDETIINLNHSIDELRKIYLELIIKRANIHLKDIEPAWKIEAVVTNSWDTEDTFSFREKVKYEDLRRKSTTWGISKDDFNIIFNGNQAKFTASRSQKRATVIALKLASLDLFDKLSGKKSILLLDDLLYEFDKNRDESVQEKIKNYDAFATSTRNIEADNVIYIEKGKVIYNGKK